MFDDYQRDERDTLKIWFCGLKVSSRYFELGHCKLDYIGYYLYYEEESLRKLVFAGVAMVTTVCSNAHCKF